MSPHHAAKLSSPLRAALFVSLLTDASVLRRTDLGEPDSPVSISSSFGAVDIAGFDKDSAAFFKANWTAGAQIHIVPSHWNFDQGSFVLVWVFANNEVDSVALSLNGSPVGEPQPVTDTVWYHTEWNVSYAAGFRGSTLRTLRRRAFCKMSTLLKFADHL